MTAGVSSTSGAGVPEAIDAPHPEPAPPVAAPAPGFRPDIQGLRAVAVLVVVLFHAGLGFPGGFVGVDVFFVVSGFVITGMLRRDRGAGGGVDLRSFYRRRVRRLLPALALLLTTVVLVAPFLAPLEVGSTTVRTGLAATLFSANLLLARATEGYFELGAEANPLLHLWTLSVEEQFYIAFPWVLAAGWRLSARRRGAPVLLVAGAAGLSFALSLALTYDLTPLGRDLSEKLAFYGAPTRAWEFGVGALLALRPWSLRGRRADVAGAAGAALLAVAVFGFDGQTTFPGVAALVPVAAAALLLVGGTDRSGATSRLLSWAPARRLGDLSYSWYLWHWPFIVCAGALFPGTGPAAAIAAAASLGPAWLSYRLVEEPIRRRRPGRPRRTLRIAVVCVALPLLAAGLALPIRDRVERRMASFETAVGDHVDLTAGCRDDKPTPGATCRWPAPGPARGTVALYGDSNAGHFAEGLIAAAGDLSLDTTVRTRAACPFLDAILVRDGQMETQCRQYYEEQLQRVRRERPDVVVVANAGIGYVDDPVMAVGAPGGTPARTEAGKARLWGEALARTVTALNDLGAVAVVLHPVPRFGAWDPHGCAALLVLSHEEGCGISEARSTLQARREATVAAEEAAVAGGRSALSYDPVPALCPGSRCRAYRDGDWWWSDYGHITVHASRALRPDLRTLLASALDRGGIERGGSAPG